MNKSIQSINQYNESLTQFTQSINRKRACPPTTLSVREQEWLPFRVVSKYQHCIVWFCHKAHMLQTNRQTDGQRELQ